MRVLCENVLCKSNDAGFCRREHLELIVITTRIVNKTPIKQTVCDSFNYSIGDNKEEKAK